LRNPKKHSLLGVNGHFEGERNDKRAFLVSFIQHSLPISTKSLSPDIVLLKHIAPPDARNILSVDIEILRSCSG
jgi:hypothetical protein